MSRASVTDEPLTVRLLGPFEASLGARPVTLTTGQLRAVLAVLAMSAGRPVTVDRLAVALWDEDQPSNARRTVQTYVARLRAALGTETIGGTPNGYVLATDPGQVDTLRFTGLLDDAAQATDPAIERAQLDEALALWRGNPFDGVRSDWLVQTQGPRLVERYLLAVERRVDLDLAEGLHPALVGQLRELTARHPLREPLWVRLLTGLDRSGRRAEALEQYERIRVRLAEELGTEPGPELRQIHADLLAGIPVDATPPGVKARAVTPRQLPAPVDGFVGRATALKALDRLLPGSTDEVPNAVVCVVTGTAGVGKTTLAVHWAHRVADRFPDGQLYVNLRGYHPSGRVMTPAAAVRGFLNALDVPPNHIPSDLDAQTALYRSLLAGKRMLVLIDNARAAEQVRHLLPSSPGCVTVITSRDQFTGLVAGEAAHPLALDLLTPDEAQDLLAVRLGVDRVEADPESAGDVIAWCARLPLALAVVAAHAARRDHSPLRALAADLRASRSHLDTLTTGDSGTDPRSVFSWSYHTLSPPAARLFRVLGLHPGPDISTSAAASLAALPTPDARAALAELCRAHLLTETLAGRFAFHDLLRAYAAELAASHDPASQRRAAVHRLLDYHLHTAHAAAMLINPQRRSLTLAPTQAGVVVGELEDYDQAMVWFADERETLLASVSVADDHGFDIHAWQLPSTLAAFCFRQAYWHDWRTTQQTAVEAARRLGDTAAEALTHRGLGSAYQFLGQLEDAHRHLICARELYDQLDEPIGKADIHWHLSSLCERQGRQAEALAHSEHSLAFAREAGDKYAEAKALNSLGWDHLQLGNQEQGLTFCQQALTLYQQLGNRLGEANTWDSVALAHHQAGNHAEAVTCYQNALGLFRELDVRHTEAGTLRRLSETHFAAADPAAGRAALQQALSILDQLDHPEAEEVRALIQAAAPQPSTSASDAS